MLKDTTWTILMRMNTALGHKGTGLLGNVACLERGLVPETREKQKARIKAQLKKMRGILDQMETEINDNL